MTMIALNLTLWLCMAFALSLVLGRIIRRSHDYEGYDETAQGALTNDTAG